MIKLHYWKAYLSQSKAYKTVKSKSFFWDGMRLVYRFQVQSLWDLMGYFLTLFVCRPLSTAPSPQGWPSPRPPRSLGSGQTPGLTRCTDWDSPRSRTCRRSVLTNTVKPVGQLYLSHIDLVVTIKLFCVVMQLCFYLALAHLSRYSLNAVKTNFYLYTQSWDVLDKLRWLVIFIIIYFIYFHFNNESRNVYKYLWIWTTIVIIKYIILFVAYSS